MLVEDQDGQKMVVVNPGPGEEPQTIVIPEQVEHFFDPGTVVNLYCVNYLPNVTHPSYRQRLFM